MKKEKIKTSRLLFLIIMVFVSITFLLPINNAVAQLIKTNPVPNGFHLGILGEGNFAQGMYAMNTDGLWEKPNTSPAMGWKSGVELSYHFLDYFGVSLGFTYGTRLQLQYHPVLYDDPELEKAFSDDKRYAHGLQIPVKLSVSVPFNDHWAFFAAAGVNLRNIENAIGYANATRKDPNTALAYETKHGFSEHGSHSCSAGDIDPYNVYVYDIAEQNPMKLKTDLLLNVGFTYRLPYSDLIRLSLLANFSLSNDVYGTYSYPLRQTNGTLSYRHNLIGMELAYIFCFKYKNH